MMDLSKLFTSIQMDNAEHIHSTGELIKIPGEAPRDSITLLDLLGNICVECERLHKNRFKVILQ